MLLVQAGKAVDDFIQTLVGKLFKYLPILLIIEQIPLLEQGDIIIDGGNSLYKDSVVGQI